MISSTSIQLCCFFLLKIPVTHVDFFFDKILKLESRHL